MNNDYLLTYRVSPVSPEAHQFAVELSVPSPATTELRVTLPAWTPGSYLIRDFARHLLAIQAEDATGARVLEQTDKQSWRVSSPIGAVTIRYRVFALDLSVRTAHLDASHGFFNGACLFLRVLGLDDVPCRVVLAPPTGRAYWNWGLATSLKPLDAPPFGFGAYQAADYAELIDHPVEMGRFESIPFQVENVPHWIVITGRHGAETACLTRDLHRLCMQHAQLFGELPLDRYFFLITTVSEGCGGLEHSHSCSLMCNRADLSPFSRDPGGDGYLSFLGLCSHEYFHLWHVKRIRPQALVGASLAEEAYTRDLWVYEGITSYYDDLALVRSGCIDVRSYLSLLARLMTRVVRNPGRESQIVADASFDAWIKLYKPSENAPNALVSYYDKGALIALALDLRIRRCTEGKRSLDDVMRVLWQRFGRTRRPVPERGVEVIAAQVAGQDLQVFFDQALRSTAELNLEDLLADVGLALRFRPALGPDDRGGLVDNLAEHHCAPPSIGLRWQAASGDAVVRHVLNGSPAECAGIAPGDVLVAVDGLRVTADNCARSMAALKANIAVPLYVFRRDELMRFRVRPRPGPADTCELCLMNDPPAAATKARNAWLGQPD